ncbi:MAG: cytochrome c oxidase accessory protein CcoG, partial [Burkholderiales bacterium]|nr:cytochrome c oxidase accessory protein CcoG [Burkholderiales bacterium]
LARAAELRVGPAQAQWVTVELRLPADAAQAAGAGVHPIHFEIERPAGDGGAPLRLQEKSTFVVPQ